MREEFLMASYRIVCVEKNGHITAVGVGTDPNKSDTRWTVAEVRAAIKNGDRFYTEDADGNKADVELYGDHWIRTDPDNETDNNLDNLRACRYQ
jgi:Protein of unknown function (DUF3892)